MACGQLKFAGDLAKDQEAAEGERDEAAAAFGLLIEEPEQQANADDEFYLWSENVDTFNLWCAIQTQWRVGMSGPTGLDYAGVKSGLSMRGVSDKKQEKHFPGLQAMERATLDEWSKNR